MATFNAVSPQIVSLASLRFHAQTVHGRPGEREREPGCAAVRRRDHAAHVDVLRVESFDCACLENGSYRRNSLRVVDVCSRLSTSAIARTRGHHAIARRQAETQARSSPQPVRDGAKRSGLTGPRTAGQSVGVLAAARGHQVLSAKTYETNETRRLEGRKEVTAR